MDAPVATAAAAAPRGCGQTEPGTFVVPAGAARVTSSAPVSLCGNRHPQAALLCCLTCPELGARSMPVLTAPPHMHGAAPFRRMPHALLWLILSMDASIPRITSTAAAAAPARTPPHWTAASLIPEKPLKHRLRCYASGHRIEWFSLHINSYNSSHAAVRARRHRCLETPRTPTHPPSMTPLLRSLRIRSCCPLPQWRPQSSARGSAAEPAR
jgi:hypothetical protein